MLQRVLNVLLFVVILVPGCTRETEEDKIKKIISSVQFAAEEKKILRIMEHLSKTYRDPQGNDYEGIKGLLAFYFFRHQTVHVYIPDTDIAVTDDSASAAFEAVLTGRNVGQDAGTILPGALGVYRFDVGLRRESNRWMVISARWEKIGEGSSRQVPVQ